MIQFVSDIGHYDLVLNLAAQARRALWIGTADIKDLYVRRGDEIVVAWKLRGGNPDG